MNSMPKYVVSRTLVDPTWTNTTVLEGNLVDDVTGLRDVVGEILVEGSHRLVG